MRQLYHDEVMEVSSFDGRRKNYMIDESSSRAVLVLAGLNGELARE